LLVILVSGCILDTRYKILNLIAKRERRDTKQQNNNDY
jgi:hypothetical protein